MFLNRLFGSEKAGPKTATHSRSRTRLAVEALDDRIVPATLSVRDATVFETYGGAFAQVLVTLSQPCAKPVSVNIATQNGTASAGADYASYFGTLTFAKGETSKTIMVKVFGDGVAEPNENFLVTLSGAKNATIADGQGLVTIVDDGVNDGYSEYLYNQWLNDYYYWNYGYYNDGGAGWLA